MNAAFLIVTSACLTGADPVPLLAPAPVEQAAPADTPTKPPEKLVAPPTPGPGPGPVVATPAGPGCGCSGCGATWYEKPSLFSRFRGGHGCDTCDTCGHTSFFDRFRSKGCGCDTCGGGGLFSRFRGRSSGCGCGCDTCGGAPATVVTAPVPVTKPGEPLKAMPKGAEPKKLPEGGKEAAAPLVPDTKAIEVGTKSPF